MATFWKILDAGEWAAARAAGVFEGSAVDLADGFIHFSTDAQVAGTLARHFAGREGLVLLAVDGARLPADALRHEPARGGELFPHLYAPLDTAAVTGVHDLPLGEDGRHRLPPGLGRG